ncbi:MAG: helix-turn-helix domain-containing protein [Candidatus Hydrogenedentes bacterium]|nr:helix-turn-helix domain-containing protein [Candidatus Hydrogenedentota bacterium]
MTKPVLVTPELWSCKEVAAALGISTRSIWRMRDTGVLPPSIKLLGSVKWSREAIMAWINQGCPDLRRLSPKNASLPGGLRYEGVKNS